MGWFSSTPATSQTESSSAAGVVPDRSAREQCWTARDAYFGCLDKNNIQVPGQETSVGVCKKEDDKYRQHCAASWVDYFNKRRVLQLRQDMMEAKAAAQLQQGGITGSAAK